MAIRMKDIARDLNVSVVTVSKVLRNHSDISEKTSERVLKRVRELNYQPNWAARSLVTGRTYTIGLVVPDLLHPFFAEIAKRISQAIRKKGYSLVIASSEEDPRVEEQQIDLLIARQVDALIVASTQLSTESFRRVEERKIPYILIDRNFSGLPAHFIGVNDEDIGRLATEHLIENGCRRIAHIRGPEISTGIGRCMGYRSTLQLHNLPFLPEYVVGARSCDDSGDVSGYETMRQLLSLSPKPDGVFCFNDPTAVGAMKAITEAGLGIPEDIGVVGSGNILYADQLRVPLSSVDQNSSGIGERAARLALKLIETKNVLKPRTVLLTPKLIVRASSAKQPTKATDRN
jgi:LacI family transcriptional regulator, galactose operon repressor